MVMLDGPFVPVALIEKLNGTDWSAPLIVGANVKLLTVRPIAAAAPVAMTRAAAETIETSAPLRSICPGTLRPGDDRNCDGRAVCAREGVARDRDADRRGDGEAAHAGARRSVEELHSG